VKTIYDVVGPLNQTPREKCVDVDRSKSIGERAVMIPYTPT
jgi:hypothetical protein